MLSYPKKLRVALAASFILLLSAAALSAAETAASPTAFLPPANQNTGAAVLIVADGDEGAQLAKWLNTRGIAGFVLRPRAAGADNTAAVADVTRAVQSLRARATELKISPQRIATLGFARGAELVAEAAYNHAVEAKPDAATALGKFSSRPALVALIWGSAMAATPTATLPPTFLVGSTRTADGMGGMIDLWTKLRAARASVDAHFFPAADAKSGLGADHPSLNTWPESFFNWARVNGLLTDEPRVPIKGLVFLDGRVLPHGYVILTPVDFVGAGPIVGRVFNSTADAPIGEFIVPANQGPIAGRYKVDVRQNMNRWLSNSFSGALVRGTGPEQVAFGHHRRLEPTIEDQRSFTKVRPSDPQDYLIEIKPGADANLALKIEVFTK